MAKNATDDYLGLDVRWLAREGYLTEYQNSTIWWSRGNEKIASIGIIARKGYIKLNYTWNKTEELDYRVNLETTPCNYGGVRYWFICPKCNRRVAKLYGGKYFLCRHCHNLTYRSCQEHDKRFSFWDKDPNDYTETDCKEILRMLRTLSDDRSDSLDKLVKRILPT